MSLPSEHWVLAAGAALLVTLLAYRLRSLSISGAIGAAVLGTSVVFTGGWWMGVILVAFFITSSALSRFTGSDETQARGSQRDWVQVAANGWGILLGSLIASITGSDAWLMFGIGAIAAATADTWSSEIGRTSKSPPRLITTLRTVPAGASGAVSSRGLAASLAGSIFIGLLTFAAATVDGLVLPIEAVTALMVVTIAGFAGGLMDSLLGASIQEKRWCDSCAMPTEANPHRCGSETRVIGGVNGINNDVVNGVCGLTGALIGYISSIL